MVMKKPRVLGLFHFKTHTAAYCLQGNQSSIANRY
jgi:hypothetical protein